MAPTLSSLLVGIGLPALGGVAAGILLTGAKLGEAKPGIVPSTKLEGSALPDDPEILKLAALAGRTTEARLKVAALLEQGASDEEISAWLAPLLLADPGWLEKFILTVPEERRVALVRETLGKIGDLHPDGLWELLRSSPFAVEAARAQDSNRQRQIDGVDALSGYSNSPLASEVLFDPAYGFSNDEIAEFFRWGTRNEINSRRILAEWLGGRWKGDLPDCIRSAWLSLRWENEAALHEFEKTLPAELSRVGDQFEALAELGQPRGPITTDPGAEDLNLLGPEELKDLAESRAMASRPLPLDTLAQLPPKLRKQTIEAYFDWHYPFLETLAAETIEALDEFDLTPEEKQSLLLSAASKECNQRGDYATALKWAARIPDEKARTGFEREVLEEWAQQDPPAALAHSATLPAGKLKERIERLATEAMP